jgi:hypothetical protein
MILFSHNLRYFGFTWCQHILLYDDHPKREHQTGSTYGSCFGEENEPGFTCKTVGRRRGSTSTTRRTCRQKLAVVCTHNRDLWADDAVKHGFVFLRRGHQGLHVLQGPGRSRARCLHGNLTNPLTNTPSRSSQENRGCDGRPWSCQWFWGGEETFHTRPRIAKTLSGALRVDGLPLQCTSCELLFLL